MMKNLINKILVESVNEKMVKVLNEKFKTSDIIEAINFLNKFSFNVEENIEILKLWHESNNIEFTIEHVLPLFIDIESLYFEWGSYNCGMGTCCDPDYIVISRNYEDEVFKLVKKDYIDRYRYNKKKRDYEDLPEICMEDPEDHKREYKTMVIGDEDLFEDLESIFGEDEWIEPLINFINNKFGTNITNFESIY